MPRIDKNPIPPYRQHPNGQAYVSHKSIPNKSRRLYLGKYDSEESRRRYQHFLVRLESRRTTDAPIFIDAGSTLGDLALAYDQHSKAHYQRGEDENGEPILATEYESMRAAVTFAVETHGSTLAIQFGPKALREVRDRLIAAKYTRKSINHTISRIRRFIRWACSEELIPTSNYHGLLCVTGLRKGQSGVKEPRRILPATLAMLDSILPYLPPVVGDLARVQYLCGMRPGEACRMQPLHLDRSGDVWLYRPPSHKTEWTGFDLVKAVPRAAQAILLRRLPADPAGYFFPPSEAKDWGIRQSKAGRKPRATKLTPSERRRVEREKRLAKRRVQQRPAGEFYSVSSYGKAIAKAIVKAKASGVKLEKFTPNQLRHGILQFISVRLGQQKAQRYAGHDSLETTAIYTQREIAELVEVARDLDDVLSA